MTLNFDLKNNNKQIKFNLTATGLDQYDLHDTEQQRSPIAVAGYAEIQRPPSRSYERSSPPRSSSRNENKLYESPTRQSPSYPRNGPSSDQPIAPNSDQYPTAQSRSPEKRGSPVKQARNLSRQPSLQRLSPQKQQQPKQSEQEIPTFRRGNEAGASIMEQQQQQQPLYDQSYGGHHDTTTPMESGYGGGPAATGDDAYQYDANSTFANYDVDQSQNYATDGIQYGDQQQYAGEEYYQPQQPANAYLDNDGQQQQQYQPQYESQGEYKYQPEPEYEYKPYQGQQQRQTTVQPSPVVAATAPAQQPKPSYPEPTAVGGGAGATRPAAAAGGAAKSNRVLPQSRAPTTAASASLSERK